MEDLGINTNEVTDTVNVSDDQVSDQGADNILDNGEVVTTEDPTDIDPDFLDLINKTLDDINKGIDNDTNQEDKQEDPSEPVFDDKNEDYISEEELEKLETSFNEMESMIQGLYSDKEELLTQIDDLHNQLEEKNNDISLIEDAWSMVISHPIIGKYAKDIVDGKDVNIPELLDKYAQDELSDIPDLENVDQVGTTQKPASLQDIFSATPDWVN